MTPELETLTPQAASGPDGRVQVEVEELAGWRRRLTLVVPAERVRRERQRLVRDYGRRLKVPGFRPGKAPAELVRKRFTAEIEEDLVRSLLQEGIAGAAEERRLDPISPPVVKSFELEKDDVLRATLEVEVRPVLALRRLAGFRLDQEVPEVGAEAVERVLARLRDERVELVTVDRAAARGDVVVADVEPLDGEGRETRGYQVLLGSGDAPAQVEERLEGARAGDEREVGLAAGDAPARGPAAADAPERRFLMRVREVKERILPALDDAFAALVSTSATLSELRERIAENLRLEAAAQAERELRERLVDLIAEANAVEVPESMVTRYVDRLLHPEPAEGGGSAHAHGGRPRGAAHDDARGAHAAHAHDPAREAEVAEILRPAAERSLRRHLIVDAVAREQGLTPTDEQVDDYIRERLESGKTFDEARHALERAGRLDELRSHLTNENVFTYLKSQSDIRIANRSPAEPRS